MKYALILASLLLTGLAPAATVIMRFETTIDASEHGGLVSAPLVVTFSFDSELAPGTGPAEANDPNDKSYGPLSSMEIKLGNEIISGTGISGSGISIWNETSDGDGFRVVVGPFPTPEDTVLGMGVTGFGFLIADPSGTLFSDASLPASLNIVSSTGLYQQTSFSFTVDHLGAVLAVSEMAFTPVGERRPFTLTVIPEPGALAICGVAAVGAAGRRRRVKR